METRDVIYQLRTQRGLSQDELAEKVFVTRQAVSRWETGETVPNTQTLKLLSQLFDVSINTLLGSPRHLVCQCCGMPLEDDFLSREQDGSLNEDYCKWCYSAGTYTYSNMEELIEVCVRNMASESLPADQARVYLQKLLPTLDYWKRYEELSDHGQFEAFKQQLMEEINALRIEGLPKVEQLYTLAGKDVDLAYPLPSGKQVSFLAPNRTYLGTQLPCEFDPEHTFGVIADTGFLLVATYGQDRSEAELVGYWRR